MRHYGVVKFRFPLEMEVLKVIANYRSIKGVINLHNIVHELQRKGVLRTNFSFVKYSFGYYSKDLEEVLNTLKKLDLIKVSKGENGLEVYEVTEKGLRVLQSMIEMLGSS